MPDVDFLRTRTQPLIGWALLGLGAAVLLASFGLANRWDEQHARTAAERQARIEADRRERENAARVPTPTLDERRIERIAPQLRQPWLPTLRLIENTTGEPIFLTALSIDPANGSIRIEGEAPTFDAALAYAKMLHEPSLVDFAHLQSHEAVNGGAPNAPSLKFTVGAKWTSR